MPLRFKRKTVSKSRVVRRRRRTTKSRVRTRKASTKLGKGAQVNYRALKPTIQRGMYPFQPAYFVKLVYGVNVTITTAGSSALSTNSLLRMNSLFDPEQTGVGHQPFMYDSLTAIYNRYQVYGASYKLTFTDPNQDGLLMGVSARDAANTTASMSGKSVDYIVERRLTNMKSVNNTGSQKAFFNGYVNIQQVLGVTRAQYNSAEADIYDAAVTASPTESVVLDMFLIDPNALVATASIRIIGTITYYARMFDLDDPAQS